MMEAESHEERWTWKIHPKQNAAFRREYSSVTTLGLVMRFYLCRRLRVAFPTKLQPPATAQICRRPRLRIPGMDTSQCVLGALSLTSGVAISLLQSAACPCSLLPTPIQSANLVAHSHVTESTLCEKSYRKCLTIEWTTTIGRRTFSLYQIFYLTMNCLRSSPGLLFCLISCFVSSPYA